MLHHTISTPFTHLGERELDRDDVVGGALHVEAGEPRPQVNKAKEEGPQLLIGGDLLVGEPGRGAGDDGPAGYLAGDIV